MATFSLDFLKKMMKVKAKADVLLNERFLEVLKRLDSVNPNFRIWLRVHRCRAVEDWLAFSALFQSIFGGKRHHGITLFSLKAALDMFTETASGLEGPPVQQSGTVKAR